MGLVIIDDEEVEEEEEDLEVKKIFEDSKAKHRRIMTGMYTCRRGRRCRVRMHFFK